MSTVPEALAATALGIEVLGISFITNLLAEVPSKETTHEEVIEASRKTGHRLADLIISVISDLSITL